MPWGRSAPEGTKPSCLSLPQSYKLWGVKTPLDSFHRHISNKFLSQGDCGKRAPRGLFLQQSRYQPALGVHTQDCCSKSAAVALEGPVPLSQAGGKGVGWSCPSSQWGTETSSPHPPDPQDRALWCKSSTFCRVTLRGPGPPPCPCAPQQGQAPSHKVTLSLAVFAFLWTPSSLLHAPKLLAQGEQP